MKNEIKTEIIDNTRIDSTNTCEIEVSVLATITLDKNYVIYLDYQTTENCDVGCVNTNLVAFQNDSYSDYQKLMNLDDDEMNNFAEKIYTEQSIQQKYDSYIEDTYERNELRNVYNANSESQFGRVK